MLHPNPAPSPSPAPSPLKPSALQNYKAWVKRHPGLVSNLDYLLYLGIWAPGRLARPTDPPAAGSSTSTSGTATSASASEVQYEFYHVLVGLLSVWHTHILEEDSGGAQLRGSYGICLDLLEQVEILYELRALHLERLGRMSRYGPLLLLEGGKTVLKLLMWSRYWGHLYLRNPGPEDYDLIESEQGLQDMIAALSRLRRRYTPSPPSPSGSGSGSWGWGWLRSKGEEATPLSPLGSPAGTPPGGGGPPPPPPPGGGSSGVGTGGLVQRAQQLLQPWRSTGVAAFGGGKGSCPEAAAAAGEEAAPSAAGCSGGSGGGSCPAAARQHMGANLVWLGEVLYLSRPLLYVALLYRHGRSSWTPWTLSLCVDVLSVYFQKRGKWHMGQAAAVQAAAAAASGSTPDRASRPTGSMGAGTGGLRRPTSLLSLALARSLRSHEWSEGERRELAQRRNKLLLYLLRSPCLEALVKGPLDQLVQATSRVPLLSMLLQYSQGLLDTCTEYYTYTSGSN